MNIYIGGAKDYSAMRGPCADGYHIPLQSEWTRLIEVGFTVGAWDGSGGDNFKTYLKLPYNGARIQSDGSVQNKGSYGYYWGSNGASSKGFRILMGSGLLALGRNRRASGYGIRPFKDKPVVPDNTWTTLKSGTGSAGIYWNSALGLISASPDGSNWITIADKNLGATTVYSDGATLSEANCGKYYQRGNNYGFPFTGSITTSSTKVNAGNYGPGNYYSSSTFIAAGNADWSSVQNDNLRGGETGIVSPVELKNAYIGEVWTPGSNTLGYYTFDDQNVSQITDFSGNNRNLTGGTMPSYTLVSGSNYSGNYAGNYANVSSGVGQKHEYGYMNGDYTMLIWVKPTSTGSCFINCLDTNEGNSSHQISLIYGYNNGQFEYYDDNAGSVKRVTIASGVTTNTWYLICYTRNGTSVKTYQNGNASNTITGANTSRTKYLFMGSSRSGDRFKGVIGDCIIENRVRTAEEISHYYDITKAQYGL